ncbi:MAG: hypothetical protein NXI31_18915 [bacterium]|nr:hypothetical protein [bacterium]
MTGIRLALLATFFGPALTGIAAPLLTAQDALDRELDFVRALAERMRFIELAKSEVERLAGEHRGAGDQDRIAQLSVQISYQGAKGRNDRAVQRTLFKEAIEKSQELIGRSSDDKVLLQARATLADASEEFGQFLLEELELAREANPEAVKGLEEESSGTFRAGIEACSKVMDELEPLRRKDELKNVEYGLFWMRKGVLMREQARAVKADRDVLVERAVSELEEMVLDFGEETALGLKGLFEIGVCSEVLGETADAIDIYTGTVDQIKTSLNEADEIGLPGETQALLFEMLQEVYVKTAEVLLREGSTETAALFEDFRKTMTEFGEEGVALFDVVDPRWGHRMLLAEARFNAETGEADKVAAAIEMVQKINDVHPNDIVGIRAKGVLKEILSVQQSLVSGKLLFEIAKGEFQNDNYEEAIKGLRRALAVMSKQEASEQGLEAWDMLGTAFAITERNLEAILAIGTGLEEYGSTNEDQAGDAADRLDRAISRHKRANKNDPLFAPTYDQYSPLIAQYSIAGAGKIFYKEGNNAFNAKDYQRAVEKYRQIPTDFQLYETARVRTAMSFALAGDVAGAEKELASYRKYVSDTELDSRDQGLIQVRKAALSDAEFLDAQLAYWQARGNETLKIAKDPTKYNSAIAKLRAFSTNHKDNKNAAGAIAYYGRLQAELGQLDRAEEAYAELKKRDTTRAARLASLIFTEYRNQEKGYDEELTKAIANDGDEKRARSNLEKVQKKLSALGLDYIANSPKPQLAVLVNTMNAFQSLGEWKRVDEIARKTLDLYGEVKEQRTKNIVDLTVRPMIGEALLRQRKFTQAYEMLVKAEEANPTQWELKRQIARCLGGWFEFDRTGSAVREPGLDKPVEAYLKYYTEYRTWALRPQVKPYSLEWYRFHWECYWFAKQASLKDTSYKQTAAKFYRLARATDNFATLKSLGAKGKELYDNFQINR